MSKHAHTFFIVIVSAALIFVLTVAELRGTLGGAFRAGVALGATLVSLVVLPVYLFNHERRITALERGRPD
jgi:hypothetical protein